MATISPKRPSRRAAASKKIIKEDSDDEESGHPIKAEPTDEEDFIPATQRSPRRQTRRKTTEVPTTPRTAARTRRARTGESVEPPHNFETPDDMPPEAVSPTKKASPRKRKSAQASKKARASTVQDPMPTLPTPKLTVGPSEPHVSPLADITNSANNEQPPAADSQKAFVPIKPLDTVMEKPMDIVIRSRALAVPQIQEDNGPKPRTVIQYLMLTNFKSYAGRQEVGPFHASFSSVVGPNGSGKSNVIDSLLFVFGFRASKMRQGKISALIHNSAAYPDLDFCEVEVHFQEIMDLVGLQSH